MSDKNYLNYWDLNIENVIYILTKIYIKKM